MVIFSLIPLVGEPIKTRSTAHGQIDGQARWARDGQIATSFAAALE